MACSRKTWALVAGAALLAGCGAKPGPPAPPPSAIRLTDASGTLGVELPRQIGGPDDYLFTMIGSGLGWIDFDRDGNLDLFLVNGSTLERMVAREPGEPSRMFRNLGGGRFEDVSATARADNTVPGTWGFGVASADYDADGWPDLFLANWGPDVLYRNRGDGSFEDVTLAAGLGDPRMGSNAAFGDIDNDGDLDLYVANYVVVDPAAPPVKPRGCQWEGMPALCGPTMFKGELDSLYRNEGDGTFTDVSDSSGIRAQGGRQSFGVVFLDQDQDGDQDIFVAVDTNLSYLFLNDGTGHFIDVGLALGVALGESGKPQAGMGVAVGDYDGDLDEDLFVTHFALDYDTLFRNDRGSWVDISHQLGFVATTWNEVGWGTAFVDLDNDGDLDIYTANGQLYFDAHKVPGHSYEQHGQAFENVDGSFRPVPRAGQSGLELKKSMRAAAFGDYDNDGDVDIAVSVLNEPPRILRNDQQGAGAWIQIALEDESMNRDALGAKVRVTAGGKVQYREHRFAYSFSSTSDPRLHFGLGGAAQVDSIEVTWPDGAREVIPGPIPARGISRIARGRTGTPPP